MQRSCQLNNEYLHSDTGVDSVVEVGMSAIKNLDNY